MYWISHAYATFYTRWATHASFTDKISTPMAFSLRSWMVVDVAATVATSGRLENSIVSNGSSGQTTWSHNRSLLNVARIFNLPHQEVTSRFQFVGVREAKSPVSCHVVDVLDLPPSFEYHVSLLSSISSESVVDFLTRFVVCSWELGFHLKMAVSSISVPLSPSLVASFWCELEQLC